MKEPENSKVPIEIIARFLSGRADTNDLIDLEQWKSASGDNEKLFEEYRVIWEKTGQLSLFTDIDIENEWNVYLDSSLIKEERAKTKHKPSSVLKNLAFKRFALVLSGLLCAGVIWLTYHEIKYKTISAGKDMKEVVLPDGTRVSLNENARITFKRKFNENRQVQLDGEAFFAIDNTRQGAFIIQSGSILVETRLSSLNIIAKKDANIVQVVVKKGKVAVYNKDFHPRTKDYLLEGEKINFSRESGIRSIQKNLDKNYDAWKTRRLEFDNSTLYYVSGLLEKLYNTEIDIMNPMLSECRITIQFQNESVINILDRICEELNLQLTETRRGFMINGRACQDLLSSSSDRLTGTVK